MCQPLPAAGGPSFSAVVPAEVPTVVSLAMLRGSLGNLRCKSPLSLMADKLSPVSAAHALLERGLTIRARLYPERRYRLRESWLRGGCQGCGLLLRPCLSNHQQWVLPPQPGSVLGLGRLCAPGQVFPSVVAAPHSELCRDTEREGRMSARLGLGRVCRQLPVGCPAATRADFS